MKDSSPTTDARLSERPSLLAVFDILGFSNRVLNHSLDEVRSVYDDLRKKTVERNALRSCDLIPIGEGRFAPALMFVDVQSAVFSDSVFAWVPLMRGMANPFLKWCSDFICEGLAMDIPIRAAIAAGNAVLDANTSTYIGKPILDAHRLEADQDWIGIAFTEDTLWPPLMADISPQLLMEYPIPVKRGKVVPLSLDWPRVWRDRFGECSSGRLLSLAAKQPSEAQKYYTNAAAFALHSQQNHNWFNSEPRDGAILRMRPYSEIEQDVQGSEKPEQEG